MTERGDIEKGGFNLGKFTENRSVCERFIRG